MGLSVNIYTDLRGYSGGLFDWGNLIFPIDLSSMSLALSTDNFVRYNLPDGLWMLSLCLFFIALWGNRKSAIPWLIFAFGMGLSLEIFQHFGITKGTFDFIDILFYLIAFVFALLIYFTLIFNKWKIGKHTYYHS